MMPSRDMPRSQAYSATSAPEAFRSSQYAAANLIWHIRNTISVGGELLYGTHLEKSSALGHAMRFQMAVQYDLFPTRN